MIVKLENDRRDTIHEFVPHDANFCRPAFASRMILLHSDRYFTYRTTEKGGECMVFQEAQLYAVNVAMGDGS